MSGGVSVRVSELFSYLVGRMLGGGDNDYPLPLPLLMLNASFLESIRRVCGSNFVIVMHTHTHTHTHLTVTLTHSLTHSLTHTNIQSLN